MIVKLEIESGEEHVLKAVRVIHQRLQPAGDVSLFKPPLAFQLADFLRQCARIYLVAHTTPTYSITYKIIRLCFVINQGLKETMDYFTCLVSPFSNL
jgi:hypothetical protein